jgi:hypothetical protein
MEGLDDCDCISDAMVVSLAATMPSSRATSAARGLDAVGVADVGVWVGVADGAVVGVAEVGTTDGGDVGAGIGAGDGGVVAQDGVEVVGEVVGAGVGEHVPGAQLHSDTPGE